MLLPFTSLMGMLSYYFAQAYELPSMKVLGSAKTVTFCVQAQGAADSCDAVTNATAAAAAAAIDSSAKVRRHTLQISACIYSMRASAHFLPLPHVRNVTL
jgi:hypothetical protein